MTHPQFESSSQHMLCFSPFASSKASFQVRSPMKTESSDECVCSSIGLDSIGESGSRNLDHLSLQNDKSNSPISSSKKLDSASPYQKSCSHETNLNRGDDTEPEREPELEHENLNALNGTPFVNCEYNGGSLNYVSTIAGDKHEKPAFQPHTNSVLDSDEWENSPYLDALDVYLGVNDTNFAATQMQQDKETLDEPERSCSVDSFATSDMSSCEDELGSESPEIDVPRKMDGDINRFVVNGNTPFPQQHMNRVNSKNPPATTSHNQRNHRTGGWHSNSWISHCPIPLTINGNNSISITNSRNCTRQLPTPVAIKTPVPTKTKIYPNIETYTEMIFPHILASNEIPSLSNAVLCSSPGPMYDHACDESLTACVCGSSSRKTTYNQAKALNRTGDRTGITWTNQGEAHKKNEHIPYQSPVMATKRTNGAMPMSLSPSSMTKSKSVLFEEMERMNDARALDTRVLQSLQCSLQDFLRFPKVLKSLCEDKFGSRYVQKLCDDKSTTIRELVRLVEEIIVPYGVELCKNIFGNYVIQKLLEITCERTRNEPETDKELSSNMWDVASLTNAGKMGEQRLNKSILDDEVVANTTNMRRTISSCNEEELRRVGMRIVKTVFLGHVRDLSMNQFACRVVQRIVVATYYPLALKVLFLEEMCSSNARYDAELTSFVVDPYGNHVLQKIIEKVPKQCLDWILRLIQGKIFQYSVHVYGCRVIQRLLTHCTNKQRVFVVNELLDKVSELCCDKYGNYVVQKMVSLETEKRTLTILIERLCRDMDKLVCDKFSSNVIEQCLRLLKEDLQRMMIGRILYPQSHSCSTSCNGKGGSHHIDVMRMESGEIHQGCLTARMVRHEFGNYVVQTLLEVGAIEYRRDLVSQIERNVTRKEMLKYSWGKQILGKMYGEYVV
jgi:uncharacterized membrane protein YheB (UPF0754 family)